ncbi:Crp/Fnr family transcriptional regulator [Denitrificimonas sp. JX-1]|uniref:Crp/Fnr family transcriptional regulator n=1 Tax=Denitrificimonas halotolerans TaxID=3098930 RepID=A0ABU5GTJ0_9GAMM|nr:Crp/Fnr family transcriptional regulator [Denitrificimonas sp. JX-1]MDY7220015.1 Crp/Fnr family transcriptional regulator [Denitrificimonas sp. JX-1]
MEPHPLYQKILRDHHLFSALNDTQLKQLLNESQLINLEKGDYIFRQGEPCHHFCFIVSGSVKIYRLTPDGQEKVFEVLGAHQTFAEAMMFMGQGCYVATAQAVLPTQLLMISNTAYTHLLRINPDASMALLAELSTRIHQRLNDIEILSLKNATHRVIRYILSQVLRACAHCNTDSFELPVAKRLVASHLSIQPETFSRIIHHLSDEGIIRVEGRLICILDRDRLESYE